MTETELLQALDDHDDLASRCAHRQIGFGEFKQAYECFYHHYALDGHESGVQERELLSKYQARIALHRRIYDEVLTKVCSDADAQKESYVRAGRIGSSEAVDRIAAIIGAKESGWRVGV